MSDNPSFLVKEKRSLDQPKTFNDAIDTTENLLNIHLVANYLNTSHVLGDNKPFKSWHFQDGTLYKSGERFLAGMNMAPYGPVLFGVDKRHWNLFQVPTVSRARFGRLHSELVGEPEWAKQSTATPNNYQVARVSISDIVVIWVPLLCFLITLLCTWSLGRALFWFILTPLEVGILFGLLGLFGQRIPRAVTLAFVNLSPVASIGVQDDY